MTAEELQSWLAFHDAQIFSLPHPRMAVIQVQSLSDPLNRVVVQHHSAERAIAFATMVFDLPIEARKRLDGRVVGEC